MIMCMKAAIIEHFGGIAIRDIPEPAIGDYEVLCEILYGTVCSGTDRHIVDGSFPWPPALPAILGHESIGRVVQRGAKVRYLDIGNMVTRVGAPASGGYASCWGGFAEFGVALDYRAARDDGVPEAVWKEHRRQQVLPDGIDAASATLFITWRETLSYATRLGFGAGKAILVIGSGGSGLSFIAHASNLGAAIRVMSGSTQREIAARRAGASTFIDYRSPDAEERLLAASPSGYDIVVDTLGRRGGGDSAVAKLKPHGTLGVYGLDEPSAYTISPFRADKTFRVYGGGYDEAEAHNQVLQFYEEGELPANVWLDMDKAFPLDDIALAIEAARNGTLVKPLVRIRG